MTRLPSEVLKAARKLIEREENWCQGHLSKGFDPVQRCAVGAVFCLGSDADNAAGDAIALLKTNIHDLADFNDTHTHAEVLELFDEAIRLAEAEGK